jgi:hypothetical protein
MDSDFVYVVKDIVPKSFCNQIIKKFEEDKKFHKCGMMGDSDHQTLNKNWKNSTEIHLGIHDEWNDVNNKLCNYIDCAFSKYIDQVVEFLIKKCEPDGEDDSQFALYYSLGTCFSFGNFSIQRILKNNRYRWHNDEQPSQSSLALTFILYLNTLEPSEGGKTKFISGKEVRPVAGNILFFPSTWTCIHSGERVHGDAKYILVGSIYREGGEKYKGK